MGTNRITRKIEVDSLDAAIQELTKLRDEHRSLSEDPQLLEALGKIGVKLTVGGVTIEIYYEW